MEALKAEKAEQAPLQAKAVGGGRHEGRTGVGKARMPKRLGKKALGAGMAGEEETGLSREGSEWSARCPPH